MHIWKNTVQVLKNAITVVWKGEYYWNNTSGSGFLTSERRLQMRKCSEKCCSNYLKVLNAEILSVSDL